MGWDRIINQSLEYWKKEVEQQTIKRVRQIIEDLTINPELGKTYYLDVDDLKSELIKEFNVEDL